MIGTILDLSGPLAPYGKQAREGMQMRVAEINAEGGINGRMLRLVVEDSGSDEARARAAALKLAEKDEVFAVVGTLGTPASRGSLPILLKHNVVSFLPISSWRAMYAPPDRLKVAFMLSTSEQLSAGLTYLVQRRHYGHVCTVVEDGDYGSEVVRGTDETLKPHAPTDAEHIVYAQRSVDYAAIAQKIRNANCELVVLGGAIRDAVGILTEMRRAGQSADVLGTSALYSNLTPQLGGRAAEGMYAVNTVSQPYADDPSKLVRDWTAEFDSRFHDAPSVFAVYGWVIVDLFAKAASKSGPVLSIDHFNQALESTTFPRDMFGSPEFHITASDRLGSHKLRVSEVIDGKWVAVSTLLEVPSP